MSKSGFGGCRLFEVLFCWTKSFIISFLGHEKVNLSMNSGIRPFGHVNLCGLGVGLVRGLEGELHFGPPAGYW